MLIAEEKICLFMEIKILKIQNNQELSLSYCLKLDNHTFHMIIQSLTTADQKNKQRE
jgi:hypothetical protein